SDPERWVLRQLAVFVGSFTLEGARAVVKSTGVDQADVLDAIDSLVAKSLIASDGSASRWRLLEPIRAYALEKLGDRGEATQAAHFHAEFFRDLVVSASPASRSDTKLRGLTLCIREIDNIRTALDWAFSPTGDPALGITLTAAYAPVWIHF